ncbi:MAG: helix-turn-helix transcriptional regulator [Bacteroidales bacterium]
MKNNIRVERAKKRISQEELAEAVHATRQSIHLIENGKTEPKLSLAFRISKFFNLKIEEIFETEQYIKY